MKLKFFFIFLLIAIVAISCRPTKDKQETSSKTSKTLPDNIAFSSGFKSFWDDLYTDSNGLNFRNYKPSESLIKKHSLSEVDGQYILSGLMTTDESFSENSANEIGCNIVNYSSNIKSFRIPINKIPDFLMIKGIIRIESSTKAYLKNK